MSEVETEPFLRSPPVTVLLAISVLLTDPFLRSEPVTVPFLMLLPVIVIAA
jgi:hypothetical protein